VQLLLKHMVDVDANDDGRTSLHWAAENGHEVDAVCLTAEGPSGRQLDRPVSFIGWTDGGLLDHLGQSRYQCGQ
jgi:ankyrin repeat protein